MVNEDEILMTLTGLHMRLLTRYSVTTQIIEEEFYFSSLRERGKFIRYVYAGV